MSITISFPATPGDATRLVSAVAEPCLVAAVALTGAGPVAQALISGAIRLTRGVDVSVRDGAMHISIA